MVWPDEDASCRVWHDCSDYLDNVCDASLLATNPTYRDGPDAVLLAWRGDMYRYLLCTFDGSGTGSNGCQCFFGHGDSFGAGGGVD